MPPKKIKSKKSTAPTLTIKCFSRGSGMTSGLELWHAQIGSEQPKFLLFDRSADKRFASDVSTWNSATGLTSTIIASFEKAASG